VWREECGEPLRRVHLRTIRRAYGEFSRHKDIWSLVEQVKSLAGAVAATTPREVEAPLRREDLHLICYDYVWP